MSKQCIHIIGLTGAKKITESICKHLKIKPFPVTISHFADGEIMAKANETVRNKTITVVQSLSKPVNENLMELLITVDSLKRASAKQINVIIPYYAYARQDRKTLGREPITSKLVAKLLETTGATRVAVVDIHSEQTQGFFDIPVDTLRATYLTSTPAFKKLSATNTVIVSPDFGAIKRAREISNAYNVPLALLDKRRPKPNQAEISNVLGDVKGKNCLISDDMVDTGGTIVAACKILKEKGAKSVSIAATHAILSGPAVERLTDAVNKKIISYIFFTNSIESVYETKIPNLSIIDLGEYLSEVIKVYHSDEGGSISKIYSDFGPHRK
jgi:ribose-phosphate pyrophosphokinase